MRGDGTWATPPNTTYAVANESTNGLMAAADKKTMNRLIGVNTVTTLANLPISKRSITATLSAATTLSVQSGMQIGEELMIRRLISPVRNTPVVFNALSTLRSPRTAGLRRRW